MTAQAKQLNKRFMPFYVANFFIGFVLWYAIEKLFMKSIGFNDATIGLALSLTGVSMLLAGIPSGVIADKWSRKGVLMVACVFLALTGFVAGISHSPWMYALAAILWGTFYALYNGIGSAVIYDTLLEETSNTTAFAKYYGRVQIVDSIALISGSLLSGLFLHFVSMRDLYLLSIPAALLAILALVFFREPTLHEQHDVSLRTKVRDVITFTRQKGLVGWIILSLFLIVVLQRLLFDFYQLWLIALAVPVVLFGPAAAAMQSSIGLSGVIAPRLKNRKLIRNILLPIVLLASLATTIHLQIVPVAGLIILQVTMFTLYVLMNEYMHHELDSGIRASGMSVAGTLGEVGFLVMAPIMGLISSQRSPFAMGWVMVGLAGVVIIAVAKVLKSKPQVTISKESLVNVEQYQK